MGLQPAYIFFWNGAGSGWGRLVRNGCSSVKKYAGSPVRIPYQNMKLFSGALNFFNTGRLNLFTRRPVTGEKKTVEAFSHMLALRSVKRFGLNAVVHI